MKQSVLIVAASAAAVAAILIVWRVAFHGHAPEQSSVDSESGAGIGTKRTEQAAASRPPAEPRARYLSSQERAASRQQREEILEKMANMSPEQREQLMAEMRQRFRSSRLRASVGSRNVSPQERARLKEYYENTRKRWQNMSQQEREEFLAQMRESGQTWKDLSEEEREKIRAETRQRFDAARQEND